MRLKAAATLLLGALLPLSPAAPALAGRDSLPADFPLPPVTFGGAGGGTSRQDAAALHRLPVIMVPGLGRDHRDWTGANPGNAPAQEGTSVYDHLLAAGFRPVELWMIDFAPAGEEMPSLEEATDDLKLFIAAVLGYTGADRVQILAHDTGCLLSRLAIGKYHIAHWIDAEVYIAGPFHGRWPPTDPRDALRGRPNAWAAIPGSDLLREILMEGETPQRTDPASGKAFLPRTMTLRDGTGLSDADFSGLPDSPALAGARNEQLPGLDHDGLRASREAAGRYIPFLARPARPLRPSEDRDGDGFRGRPFGGPDCDDLDPRVYPGAEETRGDGRDQDCNGRDLATEGGRDGELPLPPGGADE